MNRRHVPIIASLALTVGPGIRAECEPDCHDNVVLYSLAGDRDANLVRLHPATGVVLESHPITNLEALTGRLTSDAALNLYSIDGWNDPHLDRLFRIDRLTHEGTVVGETGFNWNSRYLCVDPVTDLLYGGTDDTLYTIDCTCPAKGCANGVERLNIAATWSIP